MKRKGRKHTRLLLFIFFCYESGNVFFSCWAFEQTVSFYRLAVVNYIGFHDKGMLLAGGCGNTNGEPKIERTGYLQKAFEFGKQIYPEELNTDQ